MTIQLELDARAEARLAELAESRGSDVESTLSELVNAVLFNPAPVPENPYTIEERLAALDHFSKVLPPADGSELDNCTWPRSMIYDDDRQF
jgi:hypothetical protein